VVVLGATDRVVAARRAFSSFRHASSRLRARIGGRPSPTPSKKYNVRSYLPPALYFCCAVQSGGSRVSWVLGTSCSFDACWDLRRFHARHAPRFDDAFCSCTGS
jgi:hypothetical protein